jgi:hypothetical protein
MSESLTIDDKLDKILSDVDISMLRRIVQDPTLLVRKSVDFSIDFIDCHNVVKRAIDVLINDINSFRNKEDCIITDYVLEIRNDIDRGIVFISADLYGYRNRQK